MKILFINKYDITGGAGVAAFRLHKSLETNFKTEDRFLVGIKRSDLPMVIPTRKPGLQNFIERGLNYLFNLAGLQYKFHPFSSRTILKTARDFRPDVISLHNAHGGYFKTSLITELSNIAPVVWTLHDMWAFTANAAHTFGDESWKNLKSGAGEKHRFPQIGLNTGSWLLRQKKVLYSRSNLTIVTPSKWLHDLAVQSPVLSGKKIVHIPNGLDTEIFSPADKAEARKAVGIPGNAHVLIFGAEKVANSSFKGGDDLIKILEILNSEADRQIHLIIIGIGDLHTIKEFKNLKVHSTGYIFEEKEMAKYLSAADVFIYPTRADNLPSALIEASSCGIPSVTYDVGGCGEIIINGENGFLLRPSDAQGFAAKVRLLLGDKKLYSAMSLNCRKIAESKFSALSMANSYYSLFESVLK